MESLPNRRCPACQAAGRDNGNDAGHLYLSEKGDNWICGRVEIHKDKQYFVSKHNPDTNGPVCYDDVSAETKPEAPKAPEKEGFGDATGFDFSSPPPVARDKPISFRGMPAAQYERYGCTMEIQNGTIHSVHYPVYTQCGAEFQKIRIVLPEKDFRMSEPLNGRVSKFIGQHLMRNQQELLIVEGQDDAIAADFILNEGRPASMQILCVSVPNGANLKAFKDNFDFITDKQFKRVTFCPDGDDAGLEIVEGVASLVPTMRVMKISEKDACLMLEAGKQAEFKTRYQAADKYMPPCIVNIETVLPLLQDFVPMGLSYPWANLTQDTYGMVPNQIVSVGSGPGGGKSSVLRAIQQHLMFHHGLPIGNFALEDSSETALRYLVGYMINQRIHIPGSTYDKDLVAKTAMSLKDKAFFFDNRYFKGEFSKIISTIRLLHANGVNHFFIDPVSALAAHLSSSDGNTFINAIMIDLGRLIQELPIYIMLVNHLNNPATGKGHDEGGRVLPSQFTGSKGQWRYSTDMWGYERDLLNEDPIIKNTMCIRNLKHRADGGKTGKCSYLYYSEDTGRLEEKTSSFSPVPDPSAPPAPSAPSSDQLPNNNSKPVPSEPLKQVGSLSALM